MKYIWALDLSLKCTGVAMFTNDGKCVFITSIETHPEKSTQERLFEIGEQLLSLREKYSPMKIIIEQGFTRYNLSTQQLFRVHGLANYLLHDVEQIYYPSMTIKKIVVGKGNVEKEEARQIVLTKYPEMEFKNLDESDAFIIGLAYFIEQGIVEVVRGTEDISKKNRNSRTTGTNSTRK